MTKFIENALRYARLGYSVFPVVANAKHPACKRGCSAATNDEAEIVRLWGGGRFANCNVGVSCKDMLVLDVDDAEGRGFSDLAKLRAIEDFDDESTNVVVTRSGGRHYYFKRPEGDEFVGRKKFKLDGKQTKLDCQLGNQYVLAPPSEVEGGKYRCDKDFLPLAKLPKCPRKWLDVLPKRGDDKRTTEEPLVLRPIPNVSTSDKLRDCMKYVEKIDPAVQKHGGHNAFWRACIKIFHGFDLTYEEGLGPLMRYNERCVPPWDFKDKYDAAWFHYTARKAAATDGNRGWLIQEKSEPFDVYSQNEFIQAISADAAGKKEREEEKLRVADLVAEEEATEKIPVEIDDRGVVDDRLLEAPGFLDLYCKTIRENSVCYSQTLSSAGGFALLATLLGPQVTLHGLCANSYIFALAGSGQGKDAPRKLNKFILEKADLRDAERRTFASGEAIEDELIRFPIKLFQIDEVDLLLNSLSTGKEQHQRSMQQNLLEFYSSSGEKLKARSRASGGNRQSEQEREITNLYLNIFGVCPPDEYYRQLSQRVVDGGLFGRFVIFRSPRSEYNFSNTGIRPNKIPPELIEMAKFFVSFNGSETGTDAMLAGMKKIENPYEIPMTDAARLALEEFQRATTMKSQAPGLPEYRCSVFARAGEKAYKFAAIYAASVCAPKLIKFRDENNRYDMDAIRKVFVVDVDAANWAVELTKTIIEKQLDELERYRYSTIYEKNCNDILDAICHATLTMRRRGITWISLTKKFKQFEIKELTKYVQDLITRRDVRKATRTEKNGQEVEVLEAVMKEMPV